MANIGSMLKDEITRLCRREIRKQTSTIQKATAAHRREIAALKRRLTAAERATRFASKRPAAQTTPPDASAAASMRFVAKGFRTLRHRLGLSAAQMGKLLSVSEQSIYNWETKKAVPRRTLLPTIAQLRGLGKREAAARLESMK